MPGKSHGPHNSDASRARSGVAADNPTHTRARLSDFHANVICTPVNVNDAHVHGNYTHVIAMYVYVIGINARVIVMCVPVIGIYTYAYGNYMRVIGMCARLHGIYTRDNKLRVARTRLFDLAKLPFCSQNKEIYEHARQSDTTHPSGSPASRH